MVFSREILGFVDKNGFFSEFVNVVQWELRERADEMSGSETESQ